MEVVISKGVYILLVELDEACGITVSSGRTFPLERGFYAYVGSGMSNMEARIARHLGTSKKFHWHVDYLLQRAQIRGVLSARTSQKQECLVARSLGGFLQCVPGFGCSDCRCPSHLFFSAHIETIEKRAIEAMKQQGLQVVTVLHSSQ